MLKRGITLGDNPLVFYIHKLDTASKVPVEYGRCCMISRFEPRCEYEAEPHVNSILIQVYHILLILIQNALLISCNFKLAMLFLHYSCVSVNTFIILI